VELSGKIWHQVTNNTKQNLMNVHFPTQYTIVVWNNLPVDIRAETDITRFKNILKILF